MAPRVSRAELALSYPIYACSFDPSNPKYLLVGGGGGEGRSGVGNKITLIDASRTTALREVHNIDLSRDEDSVTSLAIARSDARGVTTFAGINSSMAEHAKGVNEHLRSFRLNYPVDNGEKNGAASLPPQPLGKVSFFAPATATQETYQRVLRLSPPEQTPRLAAIATGLAPLGEVVVFDAATDTPKAADVRLRLTLQRGEEAGDVDLMARSGETDLVYCTDYDVCLVTVPAKGKAKTAPRPPLYTTPAVASGKKRPVFKAVRFLTASLLVALSNRPGRSGADILLLAISADRTSASIVLRKPLHHGINAATALATARLPGGKGQNEQHVLAVAGQDISLSIFTLDHAPTVTRSLMLRAYSLLREVHAVQMTSLAFSHFTPPEQPRTAPAQYLKLASASMGASVVVHTLPLAVHAPEQRPRYCLTPPRGAEIGQIGVSILITIVMAAVGAVLIQALTEIRGGSPEYLGAKNWLSDSLRERIAVPYMFEPVMVSSMPPLEPAAVRSTTASSAPPSPESVMVDRAPDPAADLPEDPPAASTPPPAPVSDIVEALRSPSPEAPLILHDTPAGLAAARHEEAPKPGKRWDDLHPHERAAWRKKLARAGEWVEGELETVVKGVFFGELAGAVAGAV